MVSHQFIEYIKKPYSLTNQVNVDLSDIIKDYPYFQSAHLLFTKGLYQTQALNYSKQLRKTAIVANSRSVLYELIHKQESVVNIKTPEVKIEEVVEIKKEEAINNVTISNQEIKVVYVTAPVEKQDIPRIEAKDNSVVKEINIDINQKELSILKDIENETEVPEIEVKTQEFKEQIEKEINRGIIQSYIETEIIKTPQLEKEEEKEPVSFTDWLHKVKKESASIQKVESNDGSKTAKKDDLELKNEENEKKELVFNKNKQLIDKIIESDPGRIKLGSNKFFTPAIDAKQSLLENEHLVTETLAKIYALQGNNSKAIRAYEILSLKFPQKSVYFATLIEKLKTKN